MTDEVKIEVVGEKMTALRILAHRYQCSCGHGPLFGGGMVRHLMEKHGMEKRDAYEKIDSLFAEPSVNTVRRCFNGNE